MQNETQVASQGRKETLQNLNFGHFRDSRQQTQEKTEIFGQEPFLA